MKRINFLIIFLLASISVIAKDNIEVYIGSANRFASINLPDYRNQLCRRYNVRSYHLEDCFRKCGHNWGNVGLVLEMAHITGQRVDDVCEYYAKYRHKGWHYILHKMGVHQGTHDYNKFYSHLCNYSKSWDDWYESHHKCYKYHKQHCRKSKRYHHHDY